MQLLDPWTGRVRRSFRRGPGSRAAVFGEPGRRVILVGGGRFLGATLQSFGLKGGGDPPFEVDRPEDRTLEDVALSADGKLILTVDTRDLTAWDPANGTRLRAFGGSGARVVFLPDGRHAVTAGGRTMYLWKLPTVEEMKKAERGAGGK